MCSDTNIRLWRSLGVVVLSIGSGFFLQQPVRADGQHDAVKNSEYPCGLAYWFNLDRGIWDINPYYPCSTPATPSPSAGTDFACTRVDATNINTPDHCTRWYDIGLGQANLDCYYTHDETAWIVKVCLPKGSPAPFGIESLPAGTITPVAAGTPPSATAVLANVTMVHGARNGYITANRCTTLVPGPQTQSNGNHGSLTAIANLSVVPLDTNGSFCIYNELAVNLIADVQGYFAPPSTGGQVFTPIAPSRKLDTRIAPRTQPSAGSITRVETGVAAGTTTVLVNFTMVDGTAAGYITADKCSLLTPGPQTKSSGNHSANAAIANLGVVPVDADGSFCIYNEQPVNLVVDLQGSFSPTAPLGLKFTLTTPVRKLDTRKAPLTQPTTGSITRVATGVAAGTSAVLVNLTMTDGTTAGYVTADKCSVLVAGPQSKSSGNHGISAAIANLSVVPVDNDGSFCIYNEQPVNLVVDLQGSFSATGTQQFFPIAPNRVLDTR